MTPEQRRIAVLPEHVVARIAAGEVVERPVSVVRELLDNALDAGASRITLEIGDGGLSFIRVTDDGSGIRPEEIAVAFERHATSKLDDASRLEGIGTLGFRGEALPSIAAAADVEIVSRHRTEPVGVQLALIAGRPARRQSRPAPVGTSITVRDLFGRLPARRRFLGTPAAETRRIATLAAHYALAYPGVAFRYVSGDRRALSTSGSGSLREALAAVYGHEIGSRMLDVDHDEGNVRVRGLCGPASLHRGNRGALSIFVNGRWVQSRALLFAASEAYQSQMPAGRYPVACLNVEVPPGDVDVNVHPTKAEVRLTDERAVTRAVRHAVMSALESARPAVFSVASEPVPWPATRPATEPRSAPAQPPPSLRDRLTGGVPPPVPLAPPAPVQGSLALARASAPEVEPGQRTQRETLPLLRVVGQMAATYIIAEGPDGMYLLDQHAAHERVLYDRLTGRGPAVEQQALLEPLLVELDPQQSAAAEAYAAELRELGISLEPFGEGAYLVRSLPQVIGDRDPAAGIVAIIDRLDEAEMLPERFDRAAATVACHASVRAGMQLADSDMRRIIEELERSPHPRTCPHGRPVLLHMSADMLARQFGRR